MFLTGKNALVTGSSRGLGLSIARHLQSLGCNIILTSRTHRDLELASESIPSSSIFSCDLTEPASVSHLSDFVRTTFGCLDILVCNHGSGIGKPGLLEDYNDFLTSFNLNFFSTANIIHSLQPLLARESSIICISSICGNERITGAPLAYSCAKSSLNHYVKCAAAHLALGQIRINAISPGNLLFPGSTWDAKLKLSQSTTNSYIKTEVPLASFGTTDDICNLVSYLASPLAKFVTGAILTVDGGQTRS